MRTLPLAILMLLSTAVWASKGGHGGGNPFTSFFKRQKNTEDIVCSGSFLSHAAGTLSINKSNGQEELSPGQEARLKSSLKPKGLNLFRKRHPAVLHTKQTLVGNAPFIDVVIDEAKDEPFRMRVSLNSSGQLSVGKLESSGAHRPICTDAQLASVKPFIPKDNVEPERAPASVRSVKRRQQRNNRRGFLGLGSIGSRIGRKVKTDNKMTYYEGLSPLDKRRIEEREAEKEAMSFFGAPVQGTNVRFGGVKTEDFMGPGIRMPFSKRNNTAEFTLGVGSFNSSGNPHSPSSTGATFGFGFVPKAWQ